MSANRLNTDKTVLLWVGSRQPFPTRLLFSGITTRFRLQPATTFVSSNLSLDRHLSIAIASCFYWLRHLRRSQRSLDTESAATLVQSTHSSSRIDLCNAVLAGAPKLTKATTDKLQRVLNAAARVVSGTNKFDRGLLRLRHTELHWLDVSERVAYNDTT